MPVDMLREVEAEDPIDYADLPCEKQELRRFIVSGLVERHHAVETGVSVSDVHALYLLSTAKLVLENTVLRAHLFLLRGISATWTPFSRRLRADEDMADRLAILSARYIAFAHQVTNGIHLKLTDSIFNSVIELAETGTGGRRPVWSCAG